MDKLMQMLGPVDAVMGRVLLSLIFILTGLGKMTEGMAETMAYMEAAGVPTFLFWPSALFELLGGLAILIGYQTRFVAMLMAIFCVFTAALFHSDFNDQIQRILFMKNLAIAGGFFILMRFGGGEFSLDNRAASGDS